jgi:hypothetical protein
VFVEWVKGQMGEGMGVELVTANKMKDSKLAKGCLKVRFWASRTLRQEKLLMLYPKPFGYQPPKKLTLLESIIHPQRS